VNHSIGDEVFRSERGKRRGGLFGPLAVWLLMPISTPACGSSTDPAAPFHQPGDGLAAGGASPMPAGAAGSSSGSEGLGPIQGLSGSSGGSAGPPDDPAPPDASTGCAGSSINPSGYCWRSVVIGGGGFVSGIVTSPSEPDLVYARTDVGGAYRWNDRDQNWVPLNDWVSESEVGLLGIESLALDPNAPHRLYMLAGIDYFNNGKTAILSSEDYGETFAVHEVTTQFKAHGNGLGRQNGERLAVDPSNGSVLFVGTRRDGLFRSTDYGATWAAVSSLGVTTTPNDNGIAFVVFDAAGGSVGGATRHLFVGVSRMGEPNLFESQDAGASFSPVAGQPTQFMPQRAVLSPEGVLLVTYANGAGPSGTPLEPMDRGAIWKLALDGGAWTEITPLRGDQNRAFGGLSVDAADSSRILATTINTYQEQPWGYGDRIFSSNDGGTTWVDLIDADHVVMDTNGMPWIEQHAIHWAGSIEIDPFDPERAWLTSGNGVFMTQDLSADRSTWSFAARGLEEIVPLDAASVAGAPLVTTIGDYDGFVHEDPSVSPPRGPFDPAMGTTNDLAVAALAPSRLARIGSQLYVSSDAAATWQQVAPPSAAQERNVALSADGSTLIWSGDGVSQRTGDDGATWSLIEGLSGRVAPEADAVNAAKFYAYDPSGGDVYVSEDGGASFARRSGLSPGGSRRIRSAPGVEGDVWVALGAGGLARSVDSGASFEALPSVESCAAVGFGAPHAAGSFPAVYIWGSVSGGVRGVYRSDDSGQSFVRINDDAHQYGGLGNGQFLVGDANVYGTVYMSTAGRGLVMGKLSLP
jgi:xyloglucan-specific exo-beta-1,4-glucanase